jgi:hypothetical protein
VQSETDVLKNRLQPDIVDLQPPVLVPQPNLRAPDLAPQVRVRTYDDEEWENFIREWVTAFKSAYVQIKRFGGAGDRGADVAAFKTSGGLAGAWDCFQAKHYGAPLAYSDIAPEILKILLAVLDGHCVFPDTYQFLAPRGCSTQLNQLLSNAARLKERFCSDIEDPKKLLGGSLSTEERDQVLNLAGATDFSRFKSVEVVDAIEQHRSTPFHVARFGVPLADRPASSSPPENPADHESRYLGQLLEVYDERLGPSSVIQDSEVPEQFSEHYQRQREAFYKAESLRLFARGAVPPGTFELLQSDIYDGVIDVVEDHHENGWSRVSKTLSHVSTLDLQHHTLVQIADLGDRKGICHQLANIDRLVWVKK